MKYLNELKMDGDPVFQYKVTNKIREIFLENTSQYQSIVNMFYLLYDVLVLTLARDRIFCQQVQR